MKSSRIVDALKNTVQPTIVRAGGFKFIRFNANRIDGSLGLCRTRTCLDSLCVRSRLGRKQCQSSQCWGFQFVEFRRFYS